MKINRSKSRSLNSEPDQARKQDEAGPLERQPDESVAEFEDRIKQEELEFLEMEIKDLLVEVDQRGKSLVQHPSVTHARQYRQALASFLKKALDDSRVVQRLEGKRPDLAELKNGDDSKQHVVVKVIDEQTDKIIQIVKNHQGRSVELAEHVGEIRGLLVDLLDQQNNDQDQ